MKPKLNEKNPLLRNLPLLEWSSNFFDKVDLQNCLIICVQHLYTTTYNMFTKAFQKGLKPQNLFVIGKCYSIDPIVYNQLNEDGVKVSPQSAYFNSYTAYDEEFDKHINEFFTSIIKKLDLKNFDKVIILDDGGFLIRIANEILPHTLENIVGIEQTSAGFNRLSKLNLFFPVINTARSWVKMKYESPIIINLALRKLHEKIEHLTPRPKNILIMGYGTLGQIIFSFLKDKYDISYFDANPSRSMFPSKQLNSRLSHFDLIIGSTGECSLSNQAFKYLKKPVVLASVSSSDREFDSLFLRKKISQTSNCHTDLCIQGITLLNCGFPVNFDDDYSAIDTDNFQLTRSLIFGAICQAYLTNVNTKGFLELDHQFQQALETELIKDNEYEKTDHFHNRGLKRARESSSEKIH
ncbi:hypothetical protein [Simkania negevensis]|nr:hypothetical protein [Simkania negevensis]